MDEQGRPETGLAEVIPSQTEPETVTSPGNEQVIRIPCFMVARVSRKRILGVDAKKYRKQAVLQIKAEEAAAKKPQLKTGKSNVAPKTVTPKSRPKR